VNKTNTNGLVFYDIIFFYHKIEWFFIAICNTARQLYMHLRSNNIYYCDLLAPLTINEIKYNYTWVQYGLYYGYPACCIVFFIQNRTQCRRDNTLPFRKYISILDGKGYIPCDACHCKLASGLSIHTLLVNRKHCDLFPNDN
jgi:hypothetical protein